jgi:hypothetical protein
MEVNALLIASLSPVSKIVQPPDLRTSDGAQPIRCAFQSEYRWRAGRLLIRS